MSHPPPLGIVKLKELIIPKHSSPVFFFFNVKTDPCNFFSIEEVYKVCGANGPLIDCAAVDPSASHREQQSYNRERAKLKTNFKNTEKSPLQSLSVCFILYFFVFQFFFVVFPENCDVAPFPIPVCLSTNQHT